MDAPNIRDLMITAGYNDGCVVLEAAGALGLACARKGKLRQAEIGPGLAEFSCIGSILGLVPVSLPLHDGNLEGDHTGLFLELAVA